DNKELRSSSVKFLIKFASVKISKHAPKNAKLINIIIKTILYKSEKRINKKKLKLIKIINMDIKNLIDDLSTESAKPLHKNLKE
ncbi:hypothetical protein WAH92_22095, partial [Acinetobacter baumannii]